MGVLLTLGFVLALLGIALKLLRRFAPTSSTNSRLRMEVVQRLALGPKQGIAVVRIGRQVVAVSVGEGGVNRLFDLDENEVSVPQTLGSSDNRGLPATGFSTRPSSPLDFKTALKGALKTAGLAVVLGVAMNVVPPKTAFAQGTTLPRPGAAARTQTAQPSAET